MDLATNRAPPYPSQEPRRARLFHRQRMRDRIAFLLFVLPALAWFLLLMIWPLFNMFYISSQEWRGLLKTSQFVGLDNYGYMLRDPHFLNALRNTSIHLATALPGVMIPAFVLGFFLSLRRSGYRLLRVIFFSPAMMSAVALALTFFGIYLPDGILNTLLRFVGLDSLTRLWLGERSTVLGAIIAIDFWAGIGFYAILFFAVLSNMPNEVYEAALLDGATLWTVMWRIAFPLSKGFFGVATMLHFLWILLGASQNVLILTRGGPGDYSLTLGYYLYDQAFISKRLGYSQAIGVFIFFVGILGLYLIRRVFRSSDSY